MSGTFVQFVPPTTVAPFQFQPTFANGQQCIVYVPYLEIGQRWFILVTDLSGNLVVYRAQSETGPSFAAQLTWKDAVATAALSDGHYVPIGRQVKIRISQTDTPFDGLYLGLAVDDETFTFALAANPNEAITVTGALDFPLDLLAGYSIDGNALGPLYFRADTQQFEY